MNARFQKTKVRLCLAAVALMWGAIAASANSDRETLELVAGLTNRTTNVAVSPTPLLSGTADTLINTNFISLSSTSPETNTEWQRRWTQQLELARRQRLSRLYTESTPIFIAVLTTNTPESLKRLALFELAITAQEENELSRAQQIFAHFLAKWPDDPNVPEVLLRQGLIFRQMGLGAMALTKFYGVMTSSLSLQSDKIEHYQRLVLQAQTEIADTYYEQGKYSDSIETFVRLLKNPSPLLNKAHVHFKLIRSLSALGRHEEAVKQSFAFLNVHPTSPEQPEVRFYLATSLKQLGRNGESLQQVMLLLQSQQEKAAASPSTWAYWQQKTGNEIANQLYKEGDYLRALQLYRGLAALSTNIDWQLPVSYQIGLTLERLEQPVKALEQYAAIVRREPELQNNSAPSLRAILDMARWRQEFLGWQTNAEFSARTLKVTASTNLLQAKAP